jgi:membrane-associated phospholipid phosphatase
MISIIQNFDNTIELFIFTSAYKAEFYQIASKLVDQKLLKFFPFVLIICWYWVKKSPQQLMNRQKLVEGVIISLLGIVFGRLFALILPYRERPFLNPDLSNYIPDSDILRTWSSFPSDHAVLAFAIATSLFRISPVVGILAYFHAAIFICIPRVAQGLHYPSDVIGGAIIGTLIASIFFVIQARKKLVGHILTIESKHPEFFYVSSFIILYEIIEMFESMRSIASIIFSALRQYAA